jgi:hypothetical protein
MVHLIFCISNKVMDCIRSFELKQMSLNFKFCTICKERRIETKISSSSICKRCNSDKNSLKLFSFQNNMDPAIPPCLSICMFMHGEILHINCCSIILRSEGSGGTLWGSMLFWNENNFKEFLSELGVPYESPSNNEAKSELMKRKRRLQHKIQNKIKQIIRILKIRTPTSIRK